MEIQSIVRRTEFAIKKRGAVVFSLCFLAVLILMLLPCSVGAQAGFAISGQAIGPWGGPAAFARVTVCPYTATGVPCSPQSSIYSNPSLSGSPLTQPTAADQYGNYNFYVTPGTTYLVEVAINFTITYSYFVTAASGSGGAPPGGSLYATQYNAGSGVFGGSGPGTAGNIWTSNGPSSPPSFQAPIGDIGGSGTVGTLAKFGPTTTTVQDSHINEATPGVETITQQTTISDPTCPGCAGEIKFGQGTAPSFTSGNGYIFSDASGNMMSNDNATGSGHICNSVNGQCPTGMSGMTATQVPIAATASTVTSSKPLAGAGAGITTGPISSTSGHCAQFTGASGQIADSGGACGGGGGSATAAPPYLEIGSTFYLPQDGMYAVTKPPSSPLWINSLAPATITNGTNGDILYTTAGTNTFYWQEQSGSSSVESVLQLISANTGSGAAVGGVWLWDSTNSLIYTMVEAVNTGTGAGQSLEIDSFSYNGSGNPSSGVRVSTIVGTFNGWASQFVHMKMVKSGSSILFQISPNGGQNFTTVFTQTGIGTIADGGISLLDGSTFPTAMEVASEVVQ